MSEASEILSAIHDYLTHDRFGGFAAGLSGALMGLAFGGRIFRRRTRPKYEPDTVAGRQTYESGSNYYAEQARKRRDG